MRSPLRQLPPPKNCQGARVVQRKHLSLLKLCAHTQKRHLLVPCATENHQAVPGDDWQLMPIWIG